jgi:deazaflavin-dependent oxidoreductase (nitroreductase family)
MLSIYSINPEVLMSSYSPDRYIAPRNWADVTFGKAFAWFTRHGVSLLGSRVLSVPGRTTGKPQQVPVNLLEKDGRRYLVAIRGNTQWVRNVRVAGGAQLRVGRRREEVSLTELPLEERVAVLRLYLARWGWEVSQFVEGISKQSTDAELLAAAPGIPAFEVLPK